MQPKELAQPRENPNLRKFNFSDDQDDSKKKELLLTPGKVDRRKAIDEWKSVPKSSNGDDTWFDACDDACD